jgi:hypothetical protein
VNDLIEGEQYRRVATRFEMKAATFWRSFKRVAFLGSLVDTATKAQSGQFFWAEGADISIGRRQSRE